MSVLREISRAIAISLVTLFAISLITFAATNAVPADPARIALGRAATTEQLKVYRHEQGLDRPVVTRYALWLKRFAEGDWGTSPVYRRSVRGDVSPRVVRTVLLATFGMLLALPIALLIGVYTGMRSGSRVDVATSIIALFLNSLPEFVIALVLLIILGVEFSVLPVESSAVAFGHGTARIRAYVLPTLTVALVMGPYIARMVRANVRDVVAQPYVRSAVLRGLPRRTVTWRHIVPNASLPIIAVVALSIAELLGGLVVIETVFGFPGIGKLLVDSVLSSDIPTVQAIALIMGLGYVSLNLVADGLLVLLDPRVRKP